MSDHGETISGPQPLPTLHLPVPMGVRVKIPRYYHEEPHDLWGEVQGIGFAHLVWSYLVLLDHPLTTSHGTVRIVSVIGSELEGENGIDWKIIQSENRVAAERTSNR